MGLFDNPDLELHRKGRQLKDRGSVEEGIKLIRQAAENGAPNALSSLIWHQIIIDDLNGAVKDFEYCLPRVHEWVKKENARIAKSWLASNADRKSFSDFCSYEISNSKSNVAVAHFGMGDEDKAMQLWSEAASNHGHVEARFYPIFHMCQANPKMAIGILNSAFTKKELQGLVNTMITVSNGGSGWFANWAKNGLQVLKETVQKSAAGGAAAASGAAAFMASKGIRNFINDQIDDSSDGGEGLADWFQDLF